MSAAVRSYIVQTAAACMPSSCKYGRYRRVAVLEVEPGVTRAAMISGRARGVVRVVATWERRSVGSTQRCAYERALREARAQAEELRAEALAEAAVTVAYVPEFSDVMGLAS